VRSSVIIHEFIASFIQVSLSCSGPVQVQWLILFSVVFSLKRYKIILVL
jgi:hypothetical protein